MSVQLNFDDLPLNTVPGNQYSSRGLTFTTSGPVIFNAAALGSSHHVIQSVRAGGSVDFPERAISGRFTNPTHSHVGVSVGRDMTQADSGVGLHVYNASGAEIGFKNIMIPGGQVFVFGEVFAPTANIASFTVERTADSNFYIDMLEFDDTAITHRPDFQLVYTGGDVFLRPGADAQLEVKILRLYGSTGNINFKARGGPPGLVVSSITPEPVNEAVHDTVFISIRLLPNSKAPGNNSSPSNKFFIIGVPSPSAGDSPQIINISINVLQSYDAHIISMEITQSIQTFDLPTKPDPSQSGDVEYQGVDLAAGCRTAVRVFAAFASLGPGNLRPSLEITLHGENKGEALPESPLLPDSIAFLDAVATTMTQDIRVNNGTLFTLPPSWTRGVITLRAEIVDVGLSFTPVLTFETNTTNNVFIVRNITFLDTEGQWVNPIALKIANTMPIPLLDASGNDTVFSGFKNTLPMDADKFHVLDYQQTLDVTYQYLKDASDATERASNVIEALFNALDDWGYTESSRNFFIGIFPSGKIGGHPNALTRGLTENPYFHWYDFYYNFLQQVLGHPRRISIARDAGRPLTEVAHELGHLCGRLHASNASRDASGNVIPTGADTPTEDWPPDQLGFIEGVGFDKHHGTVLFPTATNPLFDFMSYAALDSNAWISVRGWNETLIFLRPFEATHPTNSAGAVQSLRRETLVPLAAIVRARVDANGKCRIVKVGPAEGQAQVASEASAYSVILRQKDDTQNEHNAVVASTRRSEQPMYLQATIPIESWESVFKVEIWHKGTMVSDLTRPTTSPVTSKILVNSQPTTGPSGSKEITWKSTHADDIILDAKVDYLLSGTENDWKPIYSVTAASSTETFTTGPLPAHYFPYNPTARIRVRVSDGFNITTTVSEPFHSDGALPSIRILSPKPLEQLRAGCTVFLHAEAYDDLGRRISDDKSVQWVHEGKVVAAGAMTGWQTDKMAGGGRVTVGVEVKDYRERSVDAKISFDLYRR